MKTFRHSLSTVLVLFTEHTKCGDVRGAASEGDSAITVSDSVKWATKGALCTVAGKRGVWVIQRVHIAEDDNEWLVEVSASNVKGGEFRFPFHKITKHEVIL